MARSAAQRISKFTAKVVPSRVAADFTAQKDAMVAQMTTITARQVELEQAVKGVLSGESVLTTMFPPYMAFTKALASKQATVGGTVLKAFGDANVAYYVATCGCIKATLLKLALDVLGVTLTP